MRIFVTGAAGFIGSHFLRAALAAGHDVTALRMPGTNPVVPVETVPSAISTSPLSHAPTWIESTLDQVTSDQLAGHHTLVHFAAAGVNPKQATWDLCFDVNLRQSLQLWRTAVSAGIKRFVICGSCFEYGLSGARYDFIPPDAPLEPTGAYHASKAAASMAAFALCVEYKLELAVLRPFHVFGEGEGPDRFWPSLRKAALAGEDFLMTRGEQIRDFIAVEDVASFFLQTVNAPLRPGVPLIANVGTGIPRTLREFAGYLWEKWEAKGKLLFGSVEYRPNEVMRYVPGVSVVL